MYIHKYNNNIWNYDIDRSYRLFRLLLSNSNRSLLHLNSVLIAEDAIGFATFCAFVANTDPIRIPPYGAIGILKSCFRPLSSRWPVFRPFKTPTTTRFYSRGGDSTFLYVSLPIYIFSFIYTLIFDFILSILITFILSTEYLIFLCFLYFSFHEGGIKFKERISENIFLKNLSHFSEIILPYGIWPTIYLLILIGN